MKNSSIIAMGLLILFFASCKNPSISINQNVNFKVSPYDVISGFTYEITPGELSAVGDLQRIRTHLFVYDDKGVLAASDVQFLKNYNSIMNSTVDLSYGNYIAIAITDVVNYKDESITMERWTISGENRITDLTVEDAGYIGQYTILGITDYEFSVGEGLPEQHAINVKPAGALFLNRVMNIHTFSDVDFYELLIDKASDNCTFNYDGSVTVSMETSGSTYGWHTCIFHPDDFSSTNGYGYTFTLPLGSTYFKWRCKDDHGTYYGLSDDFTLDIKKGGEYMFILKASTDGFTSQYSLVNGGKGSDAPVFGLSEQTIDNQFDTSKLVEQ